MDDVRVADAAHLKLRVPHVDDLRDADRRHVRRAPLDGQVVEEEFEVADDDELTDPALLHAAGLGYSDVALVSGADASRRVDAQRPFCCSKNTERE